jgi:hypothetical protein
MTVTPPPARPLPLASIVVGLLPLGLFGFLAVVVPKFLEPLFLNPPAIAGLPMGIVIVGAGIAWSLLGLIVMATSSSALVRLFASVIFTLPALFAVIVGPAIVLIASNIGGAD